MRKSGSAWLEGTPVMDTKESGKRTHMQSNKRDIEHNTHQETRSIDGERSCETVIILFLIFNFIFLP